MSWLYYNKAELRTTPSFKDGIDYDLEYQYRKEGVRFICEISRKMDLTCNTMATAAVYFHRFYMVHSFATFPKYLTACCALFLAGKVEETPKKTKDIIRIAEECLPTTGCLEFEENPKEELLVLERILLQSMKFELQVDHPYDFLISYVKPFKDVISHGQTVESVLQVAWSFVNSSLCTTLCLQWEPEVIAIAVLHLAAKVRKYNLNSWVDNSTNQTVWWEMFVDGITTDDLDSIGHQILDCLSDDSKTDSLSRSESENNDSQTTLARSNGHNEPPPESAVIQPPPPPPPPPELRTTLPPTSVLPLPLPNPVSNVGVMNNLYLPNSIVVPSQLICLPPPGIILNPHLHHDKIAPPYQPFSRDRY